LRHLGYRATESICIPAWVRRRRWMRQRLMEMSLARNGLPVGFSTPSILQVRRIDLQKLKKMDASSLLSRPTKPWCDPRTPTFRRPSAKTESAPSDSAFSCSCATMCRRKKSGADWLQTEGCAYHAQAHVYFQPVNHFFKII
jgi:hypothetical protein